MIEQRDTVVVGTRIRVKGTVQGVGFRPCVWKLAQDNQVSGFVINDGSGVLIEAWAPQAVLDRFVCDIRNSDLPLARIDSIESQPLDESSHDAVPSQFEIRSSSPSQAKTGVSVDAATCKACLEDSTSVFSRRYRYPFTNCTNCGPRLTIIKGIPYDRADTSMSVFPLCQECEVEYKDPADRRFHAQPNACHRCGPRVSLERADGGEFSIENFTQLDEVDAAAGLIKRGQIVAIKGLGGFQLACDATNRQVVQLLRERKRRFRKPLALMARDLDIIRRYCDISPKEEELLESVNAPIVILKCLGSQAQAVAPAVAPGQTTLGFMLPSTPLHHLLMKRLDVPIVLTSGNLSEEPQCIDNDDARARLSSIADYFLFHNRDIVNRVDDSVTRVVAEVPRVIRRARGYAPAAISLPSGFSASDDILAMGGELKGTFCVVKDGRAVLSQHIGDLSDALTWEDYKKNLELFKSLFQLDAKHVVVDMHPEYMSSKLGKKIVTGSSSEMILHEVQHHHAHIASCLLENGWCNTDDKVLGVALDGLGYASEGFWGGEFLLCDYSSFERLGTFRPVALLGGNRAMKEPWRNTYAHIVAQMGWTAYKMNFGELELTAYLEAKPLKTFDAMLSSNLNSPLASSCGRLFDAVACAIGICRDEAAYEGQAAIELESIVDEQEMFHKDDTLAYPFAISLLYGHGLPYIEPLAMWQGLLGDLKVGTARGAIAARFHKGLSKAIVHMVEKLTADREPEVKTVALSGGVFQNRVLLSDVKVRLERHGFRVLTHAAVPANDGGLALGQAAICAARISRKD